MRLTLRTLLAYLDNILDPADADQLNKKIDESEFASSLVHQIRGSVRRLRLDAPSLDAQGIGSDLNSVAEYLDNVLPPDQVPALEKACLDNEVNLGEVASCHQILTLVLGEAAPVNDQMRQRAYGLAPTVGQTELPPPVSSPTSQIVAHPPHSPVPPPAPTMIVPTGHDPSIPATNDATNSTNAIVTSAINTEPAADPKADVVPTISKVQTTTASPEEVRPSKRFSKRVDSPSTKETWRAESPTLETDPALTEKAAAPVAATIVQPSMVASPSRQSARLPSPQSSHPDYMPRKSSWLRSAVLTAVVAMLILLGLLFATGTINDNLITRWLNRSQNIVASPSSKNVNEQPVAIAPTEPQETEPVLAESNTEVVTPNQQQPEGRQRHDDTRVPAFNDNVPAQAPPIEPQQPQAFVPPSDALPKMLESDAFRNSTDVEPLAEPNLPNPTTADTVLPRTNEADPIPESEAVVELALPELEFDEPVFVNNAEIDRATEGDALPELPLDAELNLVPDVAGPITPTFSNDATNEIEIDTTEAETNIDTDVANSLEPAAIDPPVAAPSPSIGDLAVSTRLPVETRLPEATIEPAMEPTKLKRDDQLLLLFDNETNSWLRVDSKVQLKEEDRLLGLPAFKSEIEIGTGMLCTVHSTARLQLGPNADITLLDGNVLLRNPEENRSQGIRFLGGERLEVKMSYRNTNVAIEAYHEHVPGTDLSDSPPPLPLAIVKVYAMDRPISVTFMGQTYDIPQGRHLLAFDNFEPRVRNTTKRPKWMLTESRRPADRGAIREWKGRLGEVTDLQAWLRTKATQKIQLNERSLATRSLAEMDDFASSVFALGDKSQHAYWDDQFDTLRRALTRGSDAQELLRGELQKAHGNDQAELMMEMLRGYNEKQLANGAAAKLVNYLDHPNLELRVFAIQNLKRITGRTLDFRPSDTLGRRSARAKGWRKALKNGRVTYGKNIPEVVQLIESFAETD